MRLKHKLTGHQGVFVKEVQPTGRPLTTIIKLDDGREYYAPSSEFINI